MFIYIGFTVIHERFLLRKACSAKISGNIIDISEEINSEHSKHYYLYVAYSVEGIVYNHKSTTGISHNKFFICQETLVYYNPDNPEQCFLTMDERIYWFLALTFVAIGLIIIFGEIKYELE